MNIFSFVDIFLTHLIIIIKQKQNKYFNLIKLN